MSQNNNSNCLLAKVNFPLYAAQMLTSRHLLVAGGGGQAKTGVANGFEIYEIYHNGTQFVAEEVQRYDTGSQVIMNCALNNSDRKSFLIVGQESHSQMYVISPKVERPSIIKQEKGQVNDALRQRRNKTNSTSSQSDDKSDDEDPKRLYFDIKTADSIQTDFAKEPLQRVVRINWNGKFMATGGIDGHLRIWNFPKMTLSKDIEAHTKEIDDIDFSPDHKRIVSISKDGLARVWNVNDGKEVMKLVWTVPEGVKYMFKRCRYATIEDQKEKYRLFTLSNPFGKSGKQKGFLQQWNIDSGRLNKIQDIDESLSALAVRDDGRFVAVGTMFTGSVLIYIAFSLQKVLHIPNAHAMFVTGLEFIPISNKEAPAISSDTEAAVISYSVDNRICIHSLQYRHMLPAWTAVILIIFILFLTFLLCSYFQI